MSNLEPIEENDIDLEGKFKGEKTEESRIAKPEEPVFKIKKEASSETIAAEKDSAYSKILSKVQAQPQSDADYGEVKEDAENVYQKIDAESQIRHLVDIALIKGVIHAVKVAKHLEDNYVLDMFHDKLIADELHSALVEKGLIKEV